MQYLEEEVLALRNSQESNKKDLLSSEYGRSVAKNINQSLKQEITEQLARAHNAIQEKQDMTEKFEKAEKARMAREEAEEK